MHAQIRTLTTTLLLLFLALSMQAADTLKIHITSLHKIPDGRYSTGNIVINQKIYTPHDTLFREINYDTASYQISSYIFYFYKDDRLFSEEYYNGNDSLLYIKKHGYDPAGNEISLIKYEIVNSKLLPVEEYISTYGTGNKILQKTFKAGKKKAQVIDYLYNESDLLLNEVRKNNPSLNKDAKSETVEYSYNDAGKLTRKHHTTFYPGRTSVMKEQYKYNANGLPLEIIISNENDEIVMTKSYEYFESGHVKYYQEKNKAGFITLLLEYNYKRHYMNYGTQVSYFDR